MKKLFPLLLVLVTILSQRCNTLKKLGAAPTELEMIMALKEALSSGLFKSFEAFENPEGDPLVRFVFPGEAVKIEKTLRDLGLDQLVERVTGKFTRAMTSAVRTSKPLFIDAIKKMTVKDAAGILITDNPHAATDYFKKEMKSGLLTAFRPVVDSTIKLEGTEQEWRNITSVYNSIPFIRPLETNLTDFVSARVVDVMFLVIANEEAQIRAKYELRKTDLMKKVFTWAERELKKKLQTR